MPVMTADMIDKVKRAGFRYVRFRKDGQLEVSKDSKKWSCFEHEPGDIGMTVPLFMTMDLDALL